ncbi:hypothetical protein SIL79_20645, partial [Shewanella indica]
MLLSIIVSLFVSLHFLSLCPHFSYEKTRPEGRAKGGVWAFYLSSFSANTGCILLPSSITVTRQTSHRMAAGSGMADENGVSSAQNSIVVQLAIFRPFSIIQKS